MRFLPALGRSGRFTPVLLAVLLLGAVSACGGSPNDGDDSADAPPPGGSASAGSPSPSEQPTVSPPGSKPAVPPPPGQGEAPRTVRGVVTKGIEAGCLVLSADSGSGTESYVLIGGDRTLLQPGRTVEVTGVPDPSIVTICQQGTPMKVTSVRAA